MKYLSHSTNVFLIILQTNPFGYELENTEWQFFFF